MIRDLVLAGAIGMVIMVFLCLFLARRQMTALNLAAAGGSAGRATVRIPKTKLERLLTDAGAPETMTGMRFRLIQVAFMALLALFMLNTLGSVYALAGVAAGYFVPMAVLRTMRARRQRTLDKDLNYILQHMQTLLTSGSTLDRVIQQIAYRHARHNSYERVFQQMAEDIRVGGGGKQYAFDRAQTSVNNPIFDRFIGFMRVNDELGAELLPLLRLAQQQIRAQTSMMNKLNAAATQTRLAGYFIPIMLGGGLLVVQILEGKGSYWAPEFTFPGNLVELFAFGMFFAGAYVINRLQTIPPTQRIFYRRRGL